MIEDRNVSINIPEGVPFTSSHFIDGNIHFNVNYNAEFPLLWTQLQPYNLTNQQNHIKDDILCQIVYFFPVSSRVISGIIYSELVIIAWSCVTLSDQLDVHYPLLRDHQ